ncbi:MAG: hypothetical protein IPH18_14540 [Chitinophagaceae bacterium]|nr:hypothetical protein [Chitinophagaceae bacterium]
MKRTKASEESKLFVESNEYSDQKTASGKTVSENIVTKNSILEPGVIGPENIRNERKWKRLATFSIVGFTILIILFFLLPYMDLPSFNYIVDSVKEGVRHKFALFILAGFLHNW